MLLEIPNHSRGVVGALVRAAVVLMTPVVFEVIKDVVDVDVLVVVVPVVMVPVVF